MNTLKESLIDGEYEAQLFDTASYCLLQEIKELTLNDIKRATNKLQEKVIDKSESNELTKCKNLILTLRAKYEASVDVNFKELELSVKNIFCIPPHVLLPEDDTQKEQFSEEDLHKVNVEIDDLISRYRGAVCMESLLRKEKKCDSCVDILERKTLEVMDNMDVLQNIFKRNNCSVPLANELEQLTNAVNQVHSLCLVEKADSEYLKEKLSV